MREIEITIDKTGKIDIEAIGYEGQGCSQDINKLVEALGTEVSRNQKCEFYQNVINNQQQQKNF
jgi:hypothetical protein